MRDEKKVCNKAVYKRKNVKLAKYKRVEKIKLQTFQNILFFSSIHSLNLGHAGRIEEGRSAFKVLTVNLQERDLWGGLGVDGRTILEWTLKR